MWAKHAGETNQMLPTYVVLVSKNVCTFNVSGRGTIPQATAENWKRKERLKATPRRMRQILSDAGQVVATIIARRRAAEH